MKKPQARSRHNGHKAEIAILGKSTTNIIDNGHNIEVKSTQRLQWARDGFRGRGKRKGRFHFMKRQHDLLLERDGLYVFVVLERGRIAERCAVSASLIEEEFEVSKRDYTCITYSRVMEI